MSQYREALPQLGDKKFLMDGGLETTLVFLENIELPVFAAIDLMGKDWGKQKLQQYYLSYIDLVKEKQTGFVLESPTWRASHGWAKQIGYSIEKLETLNREAIEMLAELRKAHESESTPMVISGCIGPRGDGYVPSQVMTVEQAKDYHAAQIALFADSEVDVISALTMNYIEEALGIALAAKEANMPVVISFTTETDGHLPDGTTLQSAIEQVDMMTDCYPVYFQINCAHPEHFRQALDSDSEWSTRIRAIRSNASNKSHAELDESTEVDRGDIDALAQHYVELTQAFPNITILGGCCGTDIEHISTIHQHCCSH